MKLMQQQQFGPIIFREECVFRKEIRLGDVITMTAQLAKMKPDASRWTIQHQFLNANNKLCATLTIDGSWLDTSKRNLLSPVPQVVIDVFNFFPKADDFVAL
jgi:acyl-CoA thioester hydrolase